MTTIEVHYDTTNIKRNEHETPIPIFITNSRTTTPASTPNESTPTKSKSNGTPPSIITTNSENDNESTNHSTITTTSTTNKNKDQLKLFEQQQLQFNKYGFLQPSLNSSLTNSLHRLSNTSTNLKSNEQLNNLTNTSSASLINSTRLNDFTNCTNYKERLQNTPVEYFAEQLPIEVIRKRELKWVEMLNAYDEWMSKRFAKLKSRCRKGIPQSIRSRAWMYLTGAYTLKAKLEKDSNENYYQKCLNNTNVDNKCIDEIKRDLHRQFPLHELFQNEIGIKGLFNVLRAYAAHNPEVGYCQSQGPVAAVLMMHMPEEDAFLVLIRISDVYLEDYYKPDLKRIQVDGHALFHLFKDINPVAYKLMKRQQIHPTMYMTEWFMCVFARTLPWCTVLRVWDMFFCEGVKVLYRVGLYLLKSIFLDKKKFNSLLTMSSTYDQQYALLNQLKDLDIDYLKESILVKESLKIQIDERDLRIIFKNAEADFDKAQKELKERREAANRK